MMFGLAYSNVTQADIKLAKNEKRLGFRVAVHELPDFMQRRITATIACDSETSSATLIDLSLSGMLIADLGINVSVGDSVTATIELDGLSATLRGAIVRTVDCGAVGIHFPESVRDGEFDPPTRLARVHRTLEQAWLKSRKKK